jgi:hypothetical protein
MFKDLAKPAEPLPKKEIKKFEDVMAEEEKQSAKQAVKEKKAAEIRAKNETGMKFDYNDPYKKALNQGKTVNANHNTETLFI